MSSLPSRNWMIYSKSLISLTSKLKAHNCTRGWIPHKNNVRWHLKRILKRLRTHTLHLNIYFQVVRVFLPIQSVGINTLRQNEKLYISASWQGTDMRNIVWMFLDKNNKNSSRTSFHWICFPDSVISMGLYWAFDNTLGINGIEIRNQNSPLNIELFKGGMVLMYLLSQYLPISNYHLSLPNTQ